MSSDTEKRAVTHRISFTLNTDTLTVSGVRSSGEVPVKEQMALGEVLSLLAEWQQGESLLESIDTYIEFDSRKQLYNYRYCFSKQGYI